MEPPFKRQRLSGSSYPEIDLDARRAQNDSRLKSIFESIFDKYGRSFNGIGDEIDMRTGEIVVNNGHILGMTNERDVGDDEYSFEELGESGEEDEDSSIEHGKRDLVALRLSQAEDAAFIEESEVSGLSDFDADSLMGDVSAESHRQQLGKKSRRAVSVPLDDEEDELASSDIEWASHSKDRSGIQEHWYPIKDKPTLADEPTIEPAWRAPPLPNIPLLEREREKVGLTSIDSMREYSDDEQEGISLWTPEVQKNPRRRHERANPKCQRSLSFARGQENNAEGPLSDLGKSEHGGRTWVKWTPEEEELLIHLKATTTLSGAAMVSYFPERPSGSAINSHWNFMITRGKASSKPQDAKILGHKTSLPSVSPRTTPLAPNGTHTEPHVHDTHRRAKTRQTVLQQSNKLFPKAESLVRNSSRPVEQPEDHHITSPYHVGGEHGMDGYIVDESNSVFEDHRAHAVYTIGESVSSASDCMTKMDFTMDEKLDEACGPSARTSDPFHASLDPPEAFGHGEIDTARHTDGSCDIAESTYQENSKESCTNTDQSYRLSTPLENEDEVVKSASEPSDQECEVISESGCEARASSRTTSITAEPGFEGLSSYSDGFVSPEVGPQSTVPMEASNLHEQINTIQSALQQEESVPFAAENINQKKAPAAEGPQKSRSTDLNSVDSVQSPNHGKPGASLEPNNGVTSSASTKRQIVQVVIPLAPTGSMNRKSEDTKKSPLSRPHIRSPLATQEIADTAFIGQPSATPENASAALGPLLPNEEILVIRTPTRSPSIAAAESQYAASVALALNVRSSLGPEIADSQPLSITPAAATPARELGTEATRPIILDTEAQSLRMTVGAATSACQQPKKATHNINSDSDRQPLHVTPEMATPALNLIEDVTESDTVESGSHPLSKNPLSKTLAAARSSSKKARKGKMSDLALSVCKGIDDYSEDELSYL